MSQAIIESSLRSQTQTNFTVGVLESIRSKWIYLIHTCITFRVNNLVCYLHKGHINPPYAIIFVSSWRCHINPPVPSRWWLILTLLLTPKVKVVSLSKTARSGRGLDPSGWTIWIATVRSKPWTSASSRVGETLTVTTVRMWGYSAYRPVWRLPQQTLPRLRPPSLYDPSTARQVTYLLSKKFSVCFEYPLLRNK